METLTFKAGGKFTIYQPIILYRKFTADHIFNGYEIITAPSVLITDQNGVVIETVAIADAGDNIESFHGLITPGFVNAHCHLELSHVKGIIAEKTGLVEFVQQVMSRRAAPAELKMDAMLRAEAEMYQSGIVAVGDICNTADSIPIKQRSKLLWHNFIEVSGFVDAVAVERLADMQVVYDSFGTYNTQNTSFSPHAPYSVSKTLFQLLNGKTTGQLITIHNQECTAENRLYEKKNGDFLELYKNFGIDISPFTATGRSAFQSWLPYFNQRQSIISVHNTAMLEADLAFENNYSAGIAPPIHYCICIIANLYIEKKVPPIDMFRKNNAAIVIGTDSYASNRGLNILEEIKTIQWETNYTIPLEEILKWATANGARALALEQSIGSFEKGKKPGIVLINGLNNLQTTPQSSSRRIL